MRLFIQYSTTGDILSASKIEVMDDSLPHPFGSMASDDGVLEVKLTGQLKALDCHEISEQYRVNKEKLALEKKAPGKKTG
jgi:hypothetical protein